MKKLMFSASAGLILAAITGCMSSKVAWLDECPNVTEPKGGKYAVLENADALAKRGVAIAKCDKSEIPARDSALPIRIQVMTGSAKDCTGAIGMVNNVFSVCTLGIWPCVKTEEYNCSVTVSGITFSKQLDYKVGSRRWSSFLLPIAAIPCPGWGDWRSSPYMNMESDAGANSFAHSAGYDVAAGLLTEKFYQEEMGKYYDYRKKKSETKRAAIRKLQAVLDNE